MGILSDLFAGESKPDSNVPVLSLAEVKTKLMALNRETAPYVVRDGSAEGVDLVAEWKIVDAKWYEIFAKAGLKKCFQLLIKLDDQNKVAVTTDKELSVEWKAGVPTLSASAEFFVGKKTEWSYSTAIGFKEDLGMGKIYEYKFQTSEIKNPVKETVLSCGWSFK